MDARELNTRIVHRMNELGFTFDQSKIDAIHVEKERRAVAKFKAKAKAAFEKMGK